MREKRISTDAIPAALYGEPNDRLHLFVHVKFGCKEAGEIPTDFGKTLSWHYLQYAKKHTITV